MRKLMRRMVAFLLVASLILGGCSNVSNQESQSADGQSESQEEQNNQEEITDLVIPKIATSELSTFNILYSELSAETQFLTNMWDALLEADSYGRLVPAIAEDWGTEDNGLSWTFKIREGMKWVNSKGEVIGDVTAHDFVFAWRQLLNPENAAFDGIECEHKLAVLLVE